jgi:hypothetical protein
MIWGAAAVAAGFEGCRDLNASREYASTKQSLAGCVASISAKIPQK